MTFGLNTSLHKQNELSHPADELYYQLIIRLDYVELKQQLRDLWDKAYEQGQEDEHGESRKPL